MRWYRYVNMGPHKDIDCHWYLHKQWSCGSVPKYWIQHNGYVYASTNKHLYKTEEKAEKALIAEIKKAFESEHNRAVRIVVESWWDKIDTEQAQWLVDNYDNIQGV